MAREASELRRQITSHLPPNDLNGHQMAEEHVRAILLDFPTPEREQRPEPRDDSPDAEVNGSNYRIEPGERER